MPQQFDNQEPAPGLTPLQAQRMTADEAKSVIALWQQERTEQTGLTDRPALPDVAEGLGIGVEDVQRLLEEVRERRAEEERALAYEQELAQIRLAEAHRTLAEEERKLAEVRRQRADLQRQRPEGGKYVQVRPPRVEDVQRLLGEVREHRAEEERKPAEVWRQRTELRRKQAEAERQRQIVQAARPSLHTKTVITRTIYIVGGIIISVALALFLTLRSLEYKRSLTRLYSERISYDAKGKPSVSDVTCGDGPDHDVPCDAAIVASEKEKYQQSYKTQVVADDEPVTAKKQHDRQTHRRDH